MRKIKDTLALLVCAGVTIYMCYSVVQGLCTSPDIIVKARATSPHEITCYGDMPQYDGMIYELDDDTTLKVGVDYWITFDTMGTDSVLDDVIRRIN